MKDKDGNEVDFSDLHTFVAQYDMEMRWKPMFCTKKKEGCFCNVCDAEIE